MNDATFVIERRCHTATPRRLDFTVAVESIRSGLNVYRPRCVTRYTSLTRRARRVIPHPLRSEAGRPSVTATNYSNDRLGQRLGDVCRRGCRPLMNDNNRSGRMRAAACVEPFASALTLLITNDVQRLTSNYCNDMRLTRRATYQKALTRGRTDHFSNIFHPVTVNYNLDLRT